MISNNAAQDFAVRIAFERDVPVVSVVGDVDIVTASSLAGVLNALIDTGYREIVADLAGLTFMDVRGLNVIADASRRTSDAGETFTVRSMPPFTRKIFELTQLSDSQTTKPSRTLSGPARPNTELVDAALRLVTSLAQATIENADGVSVTLERHGRLMTVAASNDAVLTMDRHQYETGQGPCLDAKAQGRYFYIESLAEETRWPRFVPLALNQGIHSILSSPLKSHDRPQGALNIYSSSRRAFGTRQQQIAALFAEQASEILTTAVTHEPTKS